MFKNSRTSRTESTTDQKLSNSSTRGSYNNYKPSEQITPDELRNIDWKDRCQKFERDFNKKYASKKQFYEEKLEVLERENGRLEKELRRLNSVTKAREANVAMGEDDMKELKRLKRENKDLLKSVEKNGDGDLVAVIGKLQMEIIELKNENDTLKDVGKAPLTPPPSAWGLGGLGGWFGAEAPAAEAS